jgi:hypothetical protein
MRHSLAPYWKILAIAMGGTVLIGLAAACTVHADLGFLRSTEDRDAYARRPDSYEGPVLSELSANGVVYVERAPSFAVPLTEVKSVVVQRDPAFAPTTRESLEISLGLREGKPVLEGGGDEVLRLRLEFFFKDESVGRRFADFSRQNIDQFFDVRVGGQRLGVVRFQEGSGIGGFALTLPEGPNRLKTALSPLADKVVWK